MENKEARRRRDARARAKFHAGSKGHAIQRAFSPLPVIDVIRDGEWREGGDAEERYNNPVTI